jgi:ABC-type lipoprotein release transport system permease subunit
MTTNWMEQNRELFRALKLEQVVTFIVIALIVIVAALNILIALTMMVMEKTRDIAVMMSFGVEPGQVRRIFLVQGLLISIIGTALGLVLGYIAAWAGGHYHFIHLSAEVYSIDTLPFAPRPLDGVIVAAVSIGISCWPRSTPLPPQQECSQPRRCDTSEAAEKLIRAVGPGFIPDITATELMRALAPEVCFSDISV